MKSSAGDDQWERRSEFLRTLSPFPHHLEFIPFTAAKPPDGDGRLSVTVSRLIFLKQSPKHAVLKSQSDFKGYRLLKHRIKRLKSEKTQGEPLTEITFT